MPKCHRYDGHSAIVRYYEPPKGYHTTSTVHGGPEMRYIGLALSIMILLAPAQGMAQQIIGQIKTASGAAFVVRGGDRIAARLGAPVNQLDVIETGADGSLGITFVDNSVISVGPNTHLVLEEFQFDSAKMKGNFLARLGRGTLSVVSGDIPRGSPGAMKIATPTTVLGVRGTTFVVRVDPN